MAPTSHPPFAEMVAQALVALKPGRSGASRPAITKAVGEPRAASSGAPMGVCALDTGPFLSTAPRRAADPRACGGWGAGRERRRPPIAAGLPPAPPPRREPTCAPSPALTPPLPSLPSRAAGEHYGATLKSGVVSWEKQGEPRALLGGQAPTFLAGGRGRAAPGSARALPHSPRPAAPALPGAGTPRLCCQGARLSSPGARGAWGGKGGE